MRLFFTYLLFCLLAVFISKTNAQTFQQDYQSVLHNLLMKTTHVHDHADEQSVFASETSEIKFVLLGSLKLYQTLISSQDMSVCNFTPSCSHFSNEAFRKAGFVKGVLLTSDRLQRCNGFASLSNAYRYNTQTGKYNDSVERYLRLNKRK